MFRHTYKFVSILTALTLLVLSHVAIAQNLIVGTYYSNRAYEFNTAGNNLGLFCKSSGTDRFYGMAFDANGYLYVAGSGTNNVRLFSPTGVDLGNFATMGLDATTDIAFDQGGDVYVSNFYNSTVRRFSSTGVDKGVFASFGLDEPVGLAFDSAGNLYVSNYDDGTVRRFSPTGADKGVFASGLAQPMGLAFDMAGNLYVANRGRNNIRWFSPTGVDLGVFASTGLSSPAYLAFDVNGNLYVANFGGSTVRKFSPTGVDLGDFAKGLDSPVGLAFRKSNVVVNIADVSGAPGRSVLLRGLLRRKPDAAALVGRTLTFKVDDVAVGTAVTGTDGIASLNYTIPAKAPLGDQPVTVVLPHLLYNASVVTGTLTVLNPIDTRLTVAGGKAVLGQTISLHGLLRQKSGGSVIAGKLLAFKVDGVAVGNAVTGADGWASRAFPLPNDFTLGSHTITVTSPQNSVYNASSGTGTLTVEKGKTLPTVFARTGRAGKAVKLLARLRRQSDKALLAGRTLTFLLSSGPVGTAVTGADGLASLTYTIPADTPTGKQIYTVTFDGDDFYLPSSGTGTLTVNP